MQRHDVYPSSNVGPDVIADYGWVLIERIPTITNSVGRRAPMPERSALHSSLRSMLEAESIVVYETDGGEEIKITDFAIAVDPVEPTELAFFALK
jgi:hypothetical protein